MTAEAPESRPDSGRQPEATGWSASTNARVTVIWALTKLLVLVTAALTHVSLLQQGGWSAYWGVWRQWDTYWFESIVRFGYVGPYVDALRDYHYNVAFFPGLPLLMLAGDRIGITPVAAGLLVSTVASLVAAYGIALLTRMWGGSGTWGAVALLVAPTALFLTAAYTEALFCALAFWAWVCARERAWMWAGLLAGGAALVRVNGVFLAAGLVVMFVLGRPWRAPSPTKAWLRGLWLLIPVATTFAYTAYLRSITGDWWAWSRSESEFWKRSLVAPWTALRNTYNLIWTFDPSGIPSSRMISEIVAMAILLAILVVLLVRKSWPEFTYVALTALALGTSSMYHSIPRTLVVIFPLWILLGLWLTQRRWLRWIYVIACVPMLLLVTARFTDAQWIS